MNVVHGKKVVLVVASTGYQALEYLATKKVLLAEKVSVITASDKQGGAVASDTTTTSVDILLDKLDVTKYDGIFFIGGPGAMKCLDNSTSTHLLVQAKKHSIPYGAICISVRILAKAGVLEGKKATGWNEDHALHTIFTINKVIDKSENDVVTDGLVATAIGPHAAEAFGNAIIRVLTKKVLGHDIESHN